MNVKRIVAQYDNQTIRIYQAFNNEIADEALSLGTFGSHFKLNRMTWIKPSFLWMMYRSGWATKEGQERILAIDIKRYGFDKILENVVLATFDSKVYERHENWKLQLENSNVRCQWDPDRDIFGNPKAVRAIQLGIKGDFVVSYVDEWIYKVTDITQLAFEMKKSIISNNFNECMLPVENEYPLNNSKKKILGILED